jgi:hypothetical protein
MVSSSFQYFAKEFDFQGSSALWANAATLVMHYGQQHRIGYPLWVMAQDFGYVLWAITSNYL